MDTTLLVILWVVIIVVQAIRDGKKKKNLPPTPPSESTNKNFEIPTLANDPNFPGEDVTVFKDENKPAEVRNFKQNLTEKNFQPNVEEKISSQLQKKFPLNLTAESAMNAIVLSEILGKPKLYVKNKNFLSGVESDANFF